MEDLSIIDTSVAEMGETLVYNIYFDGIRDQITEIISGAHINWRSE